jgi:hypothetical protein
MRAIVLKARQLGFSTWDGGEDRAAASRSCRIRTRWWSRTRSRRRRDLRHGGADALLPAVEGELGLGFNIKPEIIGRGFSENGRKHLVFGEPSGRLRSQGRGRRRCCRWTRRTSPESGRSETQPRPPVGVREVAGAGDAGDRDRRWCRFSTRCRTSRRRWWCWSHGERAESLLPRWISLATARDPLTGETYTPIFVPWWRDPRYAMAFPSEEARERFVSDIGRGPYGEDEPMLVEVLRAEPEQLLWRRMQIRTQHEDSIDLFRQENPATDEEAFIGSGQPGLPGHPRLARDPRGAGGAGAGCRDAAGVGVGEQAHPRRLIGDPDRRGVGAGGSGAAG